MIKLKHSLDDVVLVPFLVKGIKMERDGVPRYVLEFPEDVSFDMPRCYPTLQIQLTEAGLYDSNGYVIRKVEDK